MFSQQYVFPIYWLVKTTRLSKIMDVQRRIQHVGRPIERDLIIRILYIIYNIYTDTVSRKPPLGCRVYTLSSNSICLHIFHFDPFKSQLRFWSTHQECTESGRSSAMLATVNYVVCAGSFSYLRYFNHFNGRHDEQI